MLDRLLKTPKFFKRFTGLNINQFNNLAGRVGPVWECNERKRLLQKKRKRKIGGGSTYKLEGIRIKLLVVLLYYKLYCTQELLGMLFGIDQSNISRLIIKMTQILKATADPFLCSIFDKENESKRIRGIEEIFEMYPDLKYVVVDATESLAQRPKDKDERRNYYSGKAKRHTMKHEIVATLNRRIIRVSSMYPGKVHDKMIIDTEGTIKEIPEILNIIGDLGYNGIQKEHPLRKIIIPPKKPRGGSLSLIQKLIRKLISKKRISIEHTIGDLKNFNIIKQIFRGRKNSFSTIFKTICALHNFKLNTNSHTI